MSAARPDRRSTTRAAVRTTLQAISTAAQDAANVVSRLRAFYRPFDEDEQLRPLDTNDLLAEAISLTRPRWQDQAQSRGIAYQIETDLQPSSIVVGNEAEIRQAWVNLILNAVDAMPAGGTLSLRTRQTVDQVVLEFRDTGIGMTEEVRRRCLEPFFTTKGDQGSGLGLALVYGVIKRHGGSLEIRSEPGQGTTFIIRLPKAHGEVTAVAPPHEGDAHPGSLRVLVAEDAPSLRRILGEYLAIDGHAVESVANGRQALEAFQASRFDLVLTDRAMPELGGDELALAIKELSPGTPIVMLTGFGGLMHAANERPPGVDVVIGKPVRIAALRAAIAEVLPAAADGRGR